MQFPKSILPLLACLGLLLSACARAAASPPLPPPGRLCAAPLPPPVTTRDILQPPDLDEPPARQPFRDPSFGACLVRVTDRQADPAKGGETTGFTVPGAHVQAFNADGSRLLLDGVGGSWVLYDAVTLQPAGALSLALAPRWSRTDPLLLYSSLWTRLSAHKLHEEQAVPFHDFNNDLFWYQTHWSTLEHWIRYGGDASADGHTWAVALEEPHGRTIAFMVYDLPSDRVTAIAYQSDKDMDLRYVDAVSISPLGNYFLAYMNHACASGRTGTLDNPCGLMVYEKDLQSARGLLPALGASDVALDSDGREVLVFHDLETDMLSSLDLESGAVTPILPLETDLQTGGLDISGRACQRPGWVLVSTYDSGPAASAWMEDQLLAVEIQPGGRVVRLAHTHSVVSPAQEKSYLAHPQATVNPDFTRALFTSNWGNPDPGQVDVYLLEIDPAWLR